MPSLTIDVSHKLTQEEATRRLKERFGALLEKFGQQVTDLEETWEEHALGFGFKTLGMKVSGNVRSEASAVKVAAQIPLAAVMFRGTIEKEVRGELESILA